MNYLGVLPWLLFLAPVGFAAMSKAVSSMECFLWREFDDEVLSEDSQEAVGVKSSLLRRVRPGLGLFALGGFTIWLEQGAGLGSAG